MSLPNFKARVLTLGRSKCPRPGIVSLKIVDVVTTHTPRFHISFVTTHNPWPSVVATHDSCCAHMVSLQWRAIKCINHHVTAHWGASRSQSALRMHVLVCICSNVRQFHKIICMIHVCYHTFVCTSLPLFCQHNSVCMLQDRKKHPNAIIFHPSHLACAGTPWPSNLD